MPGGEIVKNRDTQGIKRQQNSYSLSANLTIINYSLLAGLEVQ
jgi:hypothetical protein